MDNRMNMMPILAFAVGQPKRPFKTITPIELRERLDGRSSSDLLNTVQFSNCFSKSDRDENLASKLLCTQEILHTRFM